MIANGNTYCKIASFGPVLPTEYQEVEYIESSGTQYIDTNTTIKNGTIYDIKVQITQLQETAPSGGENFFIGTMSANNAQYTLRCLVYGNNIIIQRGQFAATGVVSIQKDTNWHTYYSSKTLCKIDNTTGVPSYTITDNNLKIFLFKQNRDGYANQNSYCRIAYCKIWDDTTLVRNLIPCYRKSDNEIGMYDTVNKVFYTNQGTGTFLKGNNVVHTIRYKIPTEERPYISGHVTDGASSITFKVNQTTDITVPIDSNGNFKWYADRVVNNLNSMFNEIHNIDFVEINGFKNFIGCYQMFRATSSYDYNLKKVVFKNCDFSSATTLYGMFMRRRGLTTIKGLDNTIHSSNTTLNCTFQYCDSLIFDSDFNWNNFINSGITNFTGTFMSCKAYTGLIDLSNSSLPTTVNMCFANAFVKTIKFPQQLSSNCNVDGIFTGVYYVENITAYSVSKSMNLKDCNKLTKQSVLSLINAASVSISYTLHSTVYNKCASGGEWYTDIQAAIDAKAQQGYTVTLISA